MIKKPFIHYFCLVSMLLDLLLACSNDPKKNVQTPNIDQSVISQCVDADLEEMIVENDKDQAVSNCPICPQVELNPDMQIQRQALDLRTDADNLKAWLKVRGDANLGAETVYYWSGYIYQMKDQNPDDFRQPGVPAFEIPLLKFEGFNISRFVKDQAGNHVLLTKEASFYIDPDTNRIIDCWLNPMLDLPKEVPVLHVWNDPVNFGTGYVDYFEMSEDRLSFFTDILISYRSPLAGNEAYLPYSSSDVYQGSELFNFYVKRSDLENPNITSAPVEISWTRIGQYLPWMQMGQKNGKLIYTVRGYKLANGWDDLPQKIKDKVIQSGKMEYMHAPESVPDGFVPNVTSWRYFKQQFEAGLYQPTCQ
jgi:hypothetical protein